MNSYYVKVVVVSGNLAAPKECYVQGVYSDGSIERGTLIGVSNENNQTRAYVFEFSKRLVKELRFVNSSDLLQVFRSMKLDKETRTWIAL